MTKQPRLDEERRDNTFWDKSLMPIRAVLDKGDIEVTRDSNGNVSYNRVGGKIVYIGGGSFVKVFPKLEDVTKQIENMTTRRLLDYIIYNVKENCDYIEFNMVDVVEYCKVTNKKSIYKPIARLIELDVIKKIDGFYHRYMINPYMFYRGQYPDFRVEEAREKIKQYEKTPNSNSAKADTD